MVSTGCFKNINSKHYRIMSIDLDGEEKFGEGVKSYPALMPKREFYDVWKSNIGFVPDDENNRYFIEEYYKQVLSKLDPCRVSKELYYDILVTDAPNSEFCHRHVVAAWLDLLIGNINHVPVMEIAIDDLEVTYLGNSGEEVMEVLEDVIRKNENMHGFTSVRARYLFVKGEELEAYADEYEARTGKDGDDYRQSACFYRCDADEAERQYMAAQYRKKRGGE